VDMWKFEVSIKVPNDIVGKLPITVNSVRIPLTTILNVLKNNNKPSKIHISLPSETEYKR
jgi:hypothetical protein